MQEAKIDKKSQALSRRQFMLESAQNACAAGLVCLALDFHGHQVKANSENALRPPGALSEGNFLAACVRCGQCVRDCPYDTLKLAKFSDSIALGTPHFTAREVPCEMCEDIPCVKACPTGALDPDLTDIDDSRMGVAVLVDSETCLNMQGLRCDVCYRICPLIDKAINLVMHRNERTSVHAIFEPRVNTDLCTGCGKCERACVLEVSAIKVLPTQLAKGELGRHYRFGWKEKANKGESLIPKGIDLPDRKPITEGVN